MSLQRLMPWLVALLLLSAAAMYWAASRDYRGVSAVAAFTYIAVVIAVALNVNGAALLRSNGESRPQFHMLRRNTRLMAMVYAWGAAALTAVYVLGDLKWRHGWQYGAVMALAAAALLALVDRLGRPGNAFDTPAIFGLVVPLSYVHAAAAAGGLAYLVGTGKLATAKADWAANHVFLAGGLGIVAVALIAARTHRRLEGAGGAIGA